MNKRFSTNPNYHSLVRCAEHYFFPYYPFIGTMLVLLCFYITRRTAIQSTPLVVLSPLIIFSGHYLILDGIKRYHDYDPYGYESWMIPIFIMQVGALVASFCSRADSIYRENFAQRLGLATDDVRVREAFSLLTGTALATIQTPRELNRLLTKARRLAQQRRYNAKMFVGEEKQTYRSSIYIPHRGGRRR